MSFNIWLRETKNNIILPMCFNNFYTHSIITMIRVSCFIHIKKHFRINYVMYCFKLSKVIICYQYTLDQNEQHIV